MMLRLALVADESELVALEAEPPLVLEVPLAQRIEVEGSLLAPALRVARVEAITGAYNPEVVLPAVRLYLTKPKEADDGNGRD